MGAGSSPVVPVGCEVRPGSGRGKQRATSPCVPGSVSPQLLGTVDIIIYLLALAKVIFCSRGWYGKDFSPALGRQEGQCFSCACEGNVKRGFRKKMLRSKEMSVKKFKLLNIDCTGTASFL